MAESAAATSSDAGAEQARLRKERREAKIKAGGSARLNKITGVGGRVAGDTEQTAVSSPPSSHAADPDEVDISEHFYVPQAAPRGDAVAQDPVGAEAPLQQMMRSLDRAGQSPRPGPNAAAMQDDPLMKMMSQMMGSSPFPEMAGMPGMPAQQPQQPARPDAYTSLFRLLHALLALGLGLFVALRTPFTGTRVERERASLAREQHPLVADDDEHHKRLFFWIFATGEAVLLTTRFFLDKGRRPPPGMLWTLVGYVPEPLRGYLTVALRYGQIFTTVRSDILACIFVLGVCSWWKI